MITITKHVREETQGYKRTDTIEFVGPHGREHAIDWLLSDLDEEERKAYARRLLTEAS